MTDLSNKTCVVFDHGIFLEVALRLARDFGKVYYCVPWESAFSKLDQAIIGDGFEEIERVPEIWDVIEKVDLAVFPDVHHAAMQLFIEKHVGCPVWGGRRADALEIKKAMFKRMQNDLGMEVPEYELVHGLENLRTYCQNPDHDDRWIKLTPQFRGNRETFHHQNWALTREILDALGLDFGPVQDVLSFLAEKSIKANLEGGLDTYTVDGQHPATAVQGYETKDLAYFATVQPWDQIPKEIKAVNEFLWPVLKELHCRQMLSTEVKITEDERSFLLEPTIRFPSPAGEEQMELYGNFSEILFSGASGTLVEPVITAQFACEAMVEHTGNKDKWRAMQVPASIRRWLKLYGTVQIGNTLGIAPGFECIGAVVGIGDTPSSALDHLKENADAIKDQPVTVHVEAIARLLQEIEEAESEGVHFSDKKLPEPAEALIES